jgi:hypothetical protein
MSTVIQRIVAAALVLVGCLHLISGPFGSFGTPISSPDQSKFTGTDMDHGRAANNCRSVNNLSDTCTGAGTECLRCSLGSPLLSPDTLISSGEGGWKAAEGSPEDCGKKQIALCVVSGGTGTCTGPTQSEIGDCDDFTLAVTQNPIEP